MTTILWRAADRTGPYFGQYSFWTPCEPFARDFGLWAVREPEHPMKEPALYRAEVVMLDEETWRYDVVFGASMDIFQLRENFVAVRAKWVTCHDRSTPAQQVIYLGVEPIEAEHVQDLPV